MRKVSFDIKQNSKPSKLCILLRISLPKRFTSPRGTFWIERYVFYLADLALHKMALVLLLPSLWCQKMPGTSLSRLEEGVPSLCLLCFLPFASKRTACRHTSKVSKTWQSTEYSGARWGKSLTSPYTHPGSGTPVGDSEGGHRWLRNHLSSELQQLTLSSPYGNPPPTELTVVLPLIPSPVTFFLGKEMTIHAKADMTWCVTLPEIITLREGNGTDLKERSCDSGRKYFWTEWGRFCREL